MKHDHMMQVYGSCTVVQDVYNPNQVRRETIIAYLLFAIILDHALLTGV